MSSVGERVKKIRKEKKDNLRKGVLEAVLKIYNARELAKLDLCPLCGRLIGEYTWTIINHGNFDTIGLSGVQCSNNSCLLHNGIIYEDENKRLVAWQSGIEGKAKDNE
jgi:hypothetical protein